VLLKARVWKQSVATAMARCPTCRSDVHAAPIRLFVNLAADCPICSRLSVDRGSLHNNFGTMMVLKESLYVCSFAHVFGFSSRESASSELSHLRSAAIRGANGAGLRYCFVLLCDVKSTKQHTGFP